MKTIILKTAAAGSICGLAILGINPLISESANKLKSLKARFIERVTRVEVVKEYIEPPKLSTEELIDQISLEMKINPLITHGIARQESGKNYQDDALRFEPHLEPKFKGRNKEESRMLATSIGVMQVIPGFHLKTCGLDSYADLFDRATNIKCGLTVLKDCLSKHQSKKILAQYKLALACYNGGETYAASIIKNIGEIAIETNL